MNREQLRRYGSSELYINSLTEIFQKYIREEKSNFLMLISQELTEFARG